MKIECLLPVQEDGKVKVENGQFVFDWHLCEIVGQTASGLSIKKPDGTVSHNFKQTKDNCRDVAEEPKPVQEPPKPIKDVQPPHGTAPSKPVKAEDIKPTRKYNKKGKR